MCIAFHLVTFIYNVNCTKEHIKLNNSVIFMPIPFQQFYLLFSSVLENLPIVIRQYTLLQIKTKFACACARMRACM